MECGAQLTGELYKMKDDL